MHFPMFWGQENFVIQLCPRAPEVQGNLLRATPTSGAISAIAINPADPSLNHQMGRLMIDQTGHSQRKTPHDYVVGDLSSKADQWQKLGQIVRPTFGRDQPVMGVEHDDRCPYSCRSK